ncbi:Imm1 family immunity protein [Nocardioides speluncae]|uniref:Imm1 family immunity protein n=1 Tax=Nocardioides speluncae TaxID=2670337 RepID=UPI000D68F689
MTVSLQWWSPDGAEHAVEVESVADVERVAADAAGQFRSTTSAPGLELRRSDATEDNPASLSIAVADGRWALVHTDSEMTQHRTDSGGTGDGTHDVQWEEVTPLPSAWFVPLSEATAAVSEWIGSAVLPESVTWSDQTA